MVILLFTSSSVHAQTDDIDSLAKEYRFPEGAMGRSGYWSDESVCGKNEPPQINGVYHISTPQQLGYVAWVISYMNDAKGYKNAQFVLDADLDMSGHFWGRIPGWGSTDCFRGSFDGQGHTISNLYCVDSNRADFFQVWYLHNADHGGSFIGNASGSTFKNITFYHFYADGGRYTGLVGASYGDMTFDNVHLVRCGLSTNIFNNSGAYGGGFIGVANSSSNANKTITISNCSSDLTIRYSGWNIGGFIGSVSGPLSTVKVTNSVSYTNGNNYFEDPTIKAPLDETPAHHSRGGFVGALFGKVFFDLNNVAAYTEKDEQYMMQRNPKMTQYGIGGAFSSYIATGAGDLVSINGQNLFVDANAADYSYTDLCRFTMGVGCNMQFSTIRPIIPSLSKEHDQSLPTIVTLNENGMRMGVQYYDGSYYAVPLTDSIGCLVRYSPVSGAVSVSDYLSEQLQEKASITTDGVGQSGYLSVGRWAQYTVTPDEDHWVMADTTSTMTSKERLDAKTFKGTPTAGGKLGFEVSMRPRFRWVSHQYNVTKQQTTLCWQKHDGIDLKAWKDRKAQFYIYRNGIRVDSLSFDTESDNAYTWTDKEPKTGTINQYEVKVVCPQVFYTEDDNLSQFIQCDVDCSGLGSVKTSTSGESGSIKVMVDVPNSVAYDSCHVTVRKYILSDLDNIQLNDSTADSLGQQVFRYNTQAADSTLRLTFTDNASTTPCVKWVYQAQCHHFSPKSDAAGTSQWGNAVELLPVTNFSISSISSSKGESTNKIAVNWKVNRGGAQGAVRYALSRKLYKRGEGTLSAIEDSTGWKEIYTVTNTSTENSYTDEVLPGYVYKYMVKAYPSCDGTYAENIYQAATTIGFAASRGTIMGRITYEGNTAVQGVDVRLTSETSAFSQKGGLYSLYFDGTPATLPLVPGLGEKFWKDNWTLSFLLLPVANGDQTSPVLALPGRFAITYGGNKLYMGSAAMTLPSEGKYSNILLRHDKKAGTLTLGYTTDAEHNDTIAHWSTPISDADLMAALPSALSTYTDTLLFGGGYRGYLDEVRLWDGALTEAQIANSYNRYLSGNEEGLEAYYTFDAGVDEYAFDTSHPAGKWNNHHTTIPNIGHPALTDDCVPTEDLLTYRGTTDKNGEYQISGVPFVGEGSNYQVVPIMGTHSFTPSSTRRYISQQSLNYSDVNFTDNSSFVVPVQAQYIYGSIPAEGLNVYVDGVAQVDADHNLITTDKEGKAQVSVPIGSHLVSLSATGHTMVNKGQACQVNTITSKGLCRIDPVSQEKGYLNFQRDLTSPLMFYDSTLVRVVGRVAGGKDEASKPVGFGQGQANLGAYDIVLEPNVAGDLNTTSYGKLEITPDTIKSINSLTLYNKNNATITTDSVNGEYVALLPPVKWKIHSVTAVGDGDADIDLTKLNTLFTLNAIDSKQDTLWLDSAHNVADTLSYKLFTYNKRLDFIKYNNPVLTILNGGLDVSPSDSLMLGERKISVAYVDETSNKSIADSILIWRTDHAHDATMASYLTGYPVFISGNRYTLRFKLFETYRNHTTNKISQVPVRGAEIEINNKWTSGKIEKLSTGDMQIIDDEENTKTTQQTNAGIAEYSFEAGLPNTMGNFRLPLTVSYTVNGTMMSQSLEGYVTGGFNTHDGNNFVTEGPTQLYGVLIDPPGSGSSAYLSAGTTMGITTNRCYAVGNEIIYTRKNLYGTNVDYTKVFGGTIIQKIYAYQSGVIKNQIVDAKYTFSHGHNRAYTATLKETISTGSDAYHVGAAGDVYIGNSTNWIFAKSRFVNFCSVTDDTQDAVTSASGHKYVLQTYDGIGQQTSIGTSFALSQYDIVNVEIPLFKKLRAALIPETHYVDQLPSKDNTQYASDKQYTYYVLKSSRDKELWEDNEDYVAVRPSNLAADGFAVDSVNIYNQRIKNWQNAIASVEKQKYELFQSKDKKHYADPEEAVNIDYGYLGNTTFDAKGSKVVQSLSIVNGYTATTSHNEYGSIKLTFGSKSAFEKLKNEEYEFTTALDDSHSYTHSRDEIESYTTNVGYTLADGDLDDRFSVDVYLDGYVDSDDRFVQRGYFYNLVGGQSRNPSEGPTKSLYYKVGGEPVIISGGSVSLDEPTMKFAKHNISNIPSGSTVAVDLTLGNASVGQSTGRSYEYSLYDVNQDNKGIIAQIDGVPLQGYKVILPPSNSKTLTVTFKQSDPNVLDYDNLVYNFILFNSVNDTISLHFAPAASPITLTSNDGLVLNGEKKDQRMLMKLTGYHPEYSKFAGVRLQYRKNDYDTWTTQMYLINDSALYASSRGTMPEKWRKLASDQDSVWLDMTDLADGEYLVRAQTFSILGNEELTACSEEVGILKETTPLQVFGSPRPLSGIYAPGEEISITLNKPINASKLTSANFLAKAEVNDAPYNHYCGLHFDGANPAYTTSRINLLGTSSAIGLWYKPQVGKRSCLLSQSVTDAQGNEMPFRIWYNEDATITVELFGQAYTSKAQAVIDGDPCTDWMYLMFRYDEGSNHFTLNNGYGSASAAESSFLSEDLVRSYVRTDNVNVPLYVGGSQDGQSCYAEMQGLIVYDNESTLEKMYADKDTRKNDNIRGLAAYWPMDEGYGTKIEDKVRSRDLHINGLYHWYVPYSNYALHLNGEDQYVILNTSRSVVGADEDYVLEMLFRTAEEAKGKHMTIFSNGWGGEASPENKDNINDRLSLALTETGAIEFNFAGRTSVLGSGYNDNQWHHVALNVHRDGYATISVDTVNISSAKPVMGTALGAFSNARMTLGARRYLSQEADTFAVTDFFDGDIDEVRLWNANRTQSAINHNILLRLSGSEPGLVAYYPFERTRQIATSNVVQPTISDCVTSEQYNDGLPEMVGFAHAADTTAVAQEATVSTGAGLKPYLVESQIGLKYATSESEPNRIVLNFADYVKMSTLQGCSVNLTVADLVDNYGNYQAQPLSWNIYVDARDMRWQTPNLSLNQQVGEANQITTTITNTSTSRASWTISNIPSWLTVSQTSGMLGPQEQCEITINTVSSTAIGQYSASLLLSSDLGVDDKCVVSLTVTGTRPDWWDECATADESMTIKGGLKINGQWCTDPNSLVAAFDVNGKCHGVASPSYDKDMDRYFIDMTVHGDMPQSNRKLVFRVWDAMTGLTYSRVFFSDSETPRTDSLLFINSFIHGNFSLPSLIETSDILQQTFALHKGWNWVSNWVEPSSDNINDIFQKDKGIVTVIKRRIADAGTAFDPSESYHLYAEKDGEICVDGLAIKTEEVEISLPAAPKADSYSYQWIGFPVDRVLTLDEAFSDFKPSQDDIVKSQKGFAMYDGTSWETQDVSFLEPGQGYIYAHKGAAVTWHYPSMKTATQSPTLRTAPITAKLSPMMRQRFTTDYYRFPANMVAMELLQVDGGNAAGWQVGAYVNGQCRGWAVADSTSRVFMTIAGDADGLVTYRACNTLTGAVIAVREQHPYHRNDIMGRWESPYLLQAATTSHYVIPDALPYAFQDYTYVTATVLDAGEMAYAHDYELGAFCGAELRGAATARAGEACPIAIYGKNSEEYTFKLWDKTTFEEIDLVGTKLYDDTTAVQTIILRTPAAAAGIEQHNIDTDADGQHKWYDVGGASYGDRKPQKQGVYIRDRKKEALHR